MDPALLQLLHLYPNETRNKPQFMTTDHIFSSCKELACGLQVPTELAALQLEPKAISDPEPDQLQETLTKNALNS
eukprot:CAMPEP_0202889752 /NCGR_PEP_ID=MMETSP1392-20130828/329_1 /ASSEMBLY_ACC=CAM_ASM_000868 /TAXON_ID=225041 /ORGANISM="Chlamydomonas chlamydogama, Strain SAG 11-48b" /LENGTH=74 /DNA_ID=CAMNT_0049573153 /DNA_START=541 /DNA_END=765 /DNA_ORIENTATION=-